MRILSYNVLSLRDDRAALVEVIRAVAPDVVCAQEAPRFLGRRRKLRALAGDTGLTVATGGRPVAEVAVLVRPGLRVVATGRHALPWHPPRHRRGLAVAVVETAGTRVAVGSTHLSLDAAERLDQVRRVLRLLAAYGVPVVLAGDVNEEPAGPAWRTLTALLADAGSGPTLPASNPRRRIDGIFVDRRLAVRDSGVPEHPRIPDASDHCPVLAVLSVG